MNILPIVFVLLLILAGASVGKVEKFKHLAVLQAQTNEIVVEIERAAFNTRQRKLYKEWDKRHSYLSFRQFLKSDASQNEEQKKQNRFVIKELLKILYGHTAFYQNLEQQRSNFVDELLDQIKQAAFQKENLNKIDLIASLVLEDAELQNALYHMLKGTISWDDRKKFLDLPEAQQSKAYPSLMHFISFENSASINIQKSPPELLKAIFEDEATVNKIVAWRSDKEFYKHPDAAQRFANELKGKQKSALSDELLDLKFVTEDFSEYN